METLKKKYNELLSREKKAEFYFDDYTIPIVEREKWIPKYTKIIEELSKMIREFEAATSQILSDDVILNGFKNESGALI